ncbi:unnamed protein product [Bursaphelenchus okinawaensis]|uniref:Zinc metalloproteinase n=1 Tax=Bursaphelenchus okinawaensis TaxID=465554 RepID=A0A811KS07_9BILA|nr:unnamed protein product [Bursaphelenchus okinawaensis]CAG9110408.1 unnamed protein product [Bursaphelenchus okinawaensis]
MNRPLPATEMRRVFMDSMSEHINESERVRGFLNLIQQRLAKKKIKLHKKKELQDAQIMQWIREKDANKVNQGLEGAEVINQPVADYMFQSDMVLNTRQSRVLADAALQDLLEVDPVEKQNLTSQLRDVYGQQPEIKNNTIGNVENVEWAELLAEYDGDTNATRRKRQAQTGPSFPKNQWTVGQPISYYFHSTISPSTKILIRKAIKYWQDNTCLTFEENGSYHPKVRFFQGGGCYSQVGKAFGSAEQVISIGRGCEQFGIITHEIAHTLGFFHSQSRYDRDGFVNIVYSNLSPSMASQFSKQTESTNNNYGVEYDYGSVMHYADTDSSKGVVTMLAKDKIYQHTMGNNVGPSFADLLAMNIYYGCVQNCANGVLCKNGGFRRHDSCDICICPSGFGGKDCSELPLGEFSAEQDCGQVISATREWQYLSNRVISKQINLADRHSSCTWHIKANPNEKVQIKLLDVYGACSAGCFYSGIEIKVKDFTMTGSRVCCQSDADNLGYLESDGDTAVIIAFTAYKTRGFKLQFRSVKYPNRPSCQDKQTDCARLSSLCSHARYYKLMTERCEKTCLRCQPEVDTPAETQIRNLAPDSDADEEPRPECAETETCDHWKKNGFCESDFYSTEIKKRHCGKTCNLCTP